MGHRGVGLFPDLHCALDGIQTRSPPASAGGFYSSEMLTQTVTSPMNRSPERKRWDTGSLGDTG